jgi:DNA processing protein
LLAEHGSAEAALDALPEVARAAGVTEYKVCPEGVAAAELKAGKLAGAQLIPYGGREYPKSLMTLPDAPPLLWAIGNTALLQKPMVALVGARNASSLGTRMARSLSTALTKDGYVVVSGLARGVDTAAHLAALEGGTVAVMAGGVDVIYPAENAVLGQEIGEQGLRISEQPMGTVPQARHFPTRNRIISGLAEAVVVVEAAARSGSLITAKNALDQGREVLVVPGHPFDARAAGCNMLIRDGATLVRNAADVIEAISARAPQQDAQPNLPLAMPAATVPPAPSETRSLQDISQLHSEILSRLGPSPLAEDQLIRDLATPAGKVSPELLTLELEGKIIRQPGGLLALV